jgi:hypothetical protein
MPNRRDDYFQLREIERYTIQPLESPIEDASLQMDSLAPLPDPKLGRYRHYKGGEYEVIGVARHSETLEPLVLYRPLYSDIGLWVRPYAMFFEDVESDGVKQPRFAPMA